jgi:hypothetical protein
MSIDALMERAGALSPADVLGGIRAAEAARTPALEAALGRHLGLHPGDHFYTPHMLEAAALGWQAGIIAFDRLERTFLPPAVAWIPPGLSPEYFTVALERDHMRAPTYWPFMQDAPVADHDLSISPKWLGHGIVHTLVGFGRWPGLREWDVMQMARLSEAVAAWWWYWLAEVGRLHCPAHDVYDGDWVPACGACQHLHQEGLEPAQRAARVEAGLATAAEGLLFLVEEVAAYAAGVKRRELVPPSHSLTVGEACDYARVHTRRLRSPAFSRWVEHLLVPERDYATSPDGFARQALAVIDALVAGGGTGAAAAAATTPGFADRPARAARVARDVALRLCHAAALAGDDQRYQASLTALAAAARALDAGADAACLGAALELAAAEVTARPAPGLDATALFSLGYHPGVEPPPLRAARRAALARRVEASGTPTRAQWRAVLADAVLDGRARRFDLAGELAEAARAVAPAQADFFAWLAEALRLAGPDDTTRLRERLWFYRLGRESLGPPEGFAALSVRTNPYFLAIGSPWDPDALDAVLGGTAPAPPAAASQSAAALVGPGRTRPRLLGGTAERLHFIAMLGEPLPLPVLLAQPGVSPAALERLVAEDLLIVYEG